MRKEVKIIFKVGEWTIGSIERKGKGWIGVNHNLVEQSFNCRSDAESWIMSGYFK